MNNNEMKNHEKKFTYSKIQVFITGVIFLSSILFVAYLYISGKITDAFDTTAIVTIITVSGAIFGSNLCWYSKKAASENQYKLRMSLFADSARVRLDYNEKMMLLMKKYNMTQEDIDRINESGDLDDFMESSIQDVVTGLDTAKDDADSENTIDTFNIM